MGCAQSTVDNEEPVARCKERRQWMKKAVAARNAFAAAHSGYGVALKNTGAALSDFGQGEVPETDHGRPSASSSAVGDVVGLLGPPVVPPPIDNLYPPPPLPAEFSSPSPLQRSISLPDLPKKFPAKIQTDDAIREEEEDDEGEEEVVGEEEEEEEEGGGLNRRRRRTAVPADSPSPSPSPAPPPPAPPPPPPLLQPSQSSLQPEPPPMSETWDYFFSTDQNMTGPSLSPADEIQPEREDAVEEKFNTSTPPPAIVKRHHMVGGNDDPVTAEKVVAELLSPKEPRKQKQGSNVHHQHAVSASGLDSKKGKPLLPTPPSVYLLKVLTDLDDLFLKASESTHDVSKMLEATRMHYHSNFSDGRGHIDHSARVMRVITWNRSFKRVPGAEGVKDDDDDDKWETHATVLDKIVAWEKKLFDGVKASEQMKIEYHRKVTLLNRQKKRGASTASLERTKAAVSHLHTRYIVDLQSMDLTLSEIQRLRDKQLYPKLVELVEGMAKMWEAMHMHHHNQLKIVEDLIAVDFRNAPKGTSQLHYRHTLQLLNIVKEWHTEFDNLVTHQKEYVNALNCWLKLNVISTESSLKERVSSPPRPGHPQIHSLLRAWHDHLEGLPSELAKSAIFSFSAVINTIASLQEEELKQQESCEAAHSEYVRKKRALEEYQKRTGSEVGLKDPESGEGGAQKNPVEARRFEVESQKTRLDEQLDAHRRLCKQVREKSFNSLKTHLPELFRVMMEFSDSCCRMYANLKLIGR